MPIKSHFMIYFLLLSVSLGIVYNPITKIDINDGALSDVKKYIAIYEGKSLKEIPKPYRYRFVIPYLARCIPIPPPIVTERFEIDEIKIIKYKFGILNAFGLSLAAYFLFLFCMKLGIARMMSLLGSFLFLTNFYVINYAGLPFVDAFSYFFLIFCFYTILAQRNFLLFTAFMLGIFVRETLVLCFVYILTIEQPIPEKMKKIALCMPGLLLYLYVRIVLLPTDIGYNYTLQRFSEVMVNYLAGLSNWMYAFLNLFFSFGFLWVLAVKGLLTLKSNGDKKLNSLLPIVPLVLIIPFLIGTDLGRIWFLVFPVVIPLSLIGLAPILGLEVFERKIREKM